MSNQSIHEKWFSSMADPSLSTGAISNSSYEERYVKHDEGYPDLDTDLMSLKLDDCWEDIKCGHINEWMTVEHFRAKYDEVFDRRDLIDGLALMTNAASKSCAAIAANNSELPYQLYARLIGQISEYEIVKRYLSSLTRIKSFSLLPINAQWPHPNSPHYVVHYHDSEVKAVCSLKNEDLFVLGCSRGIIFIYNTKKRKIIETLNGHTASISSLAVSSEGQYMVSGSSDNTIRLWDRTLSSWSSKILLTHTASVPSVSIIADGRWIASASGDRRIRLWDTNGQSLSAKVLEEHTGSVNCVSVSADGRWLVSGSFDCNVMLWATTNQTIPTKVLKRHTSSVRSVRISAVGRWIASGSQDRTVRICDAHRSSVQGYVIDGHRPGSLSVNISADGGRIVYGSATGTLCHWARQQPYVPPKKLERQTDAVNSVIVNADGSWIVSGSSDHTVRCWPTNEPSLSPNVVEGHADLVISVSVSDDGRWIVSRSFDRTVRLWDTQRPCSSTVLLEGQNLFGIRVNVTSDGQWIMSRSYDCTVKVWATRYPSAAPTVLEGHTDFVNNLCVGADGNSIVSGSRDGTVRVWDSDGNAFKILNGQSGPVSNVAITANGKWIASAGDDGVVQIWNHQSWHLCYVLLVPERVRSLSFNSTNALNITTWIGSVIVEMKGDDVNVDGYILTALSESTLRYIAGHRSLARVTREQRGRHGPLSSRGTGRVRQKTITEDEEFVQLEARKTQERSKEDLSQLVSGL